MILPYRVGMLGANDLPPSLEAHIMYRVHTQNIYFLPMNDGGLPEKEYCIGIFRKSSQSKRNKKLSFYNIF